MFTVTHNEVKYYQFETFAGLKHGIFTRQGGVSKTPYDSLNLGGTVGDAPDAVRRNHEIIHEALGVDEARSVTTWLVHGVDVVYVDGPRADRHWFAQADAMITDRAGTSLVMRFADCTPLYFFDPVQGVIGMAHAGWRGTVNGMGSRTVQAMMKRFGSRPVDIVAGIGPAVGPQRYQVGEEVVSAALAYFGADAPVIRRDPSDGTAYLDLWTANQIDLLRAGVEQIEVAELCTATNTREFYSHRAENGVTGRFGAILSL